jgi:hypothetical protein
MLSLDKDNSMLSLDNDKDNRAADTSYLSLCLYTQNRSHTMCPKHTVCSCCCPKQYNIWAQTHTVCVLVVGLHSPNHCVAKNNIIIGWPKHTQCVLVVVPNIPQTIGWSLAKNNMIIAWPKHTSSRHVRHVRILIHNIHHLVVAVVLVLVLAISNSRSNSSRSNS